jgi:23S rRNA-intervening sequence protein
VFSERWPVSFEELDTWNKVHELVLAVYQLTTQFPKDEDSELFHN